MKATKDCRICGESKATTEFYEDKAAKDGHRGECKPCMNGVRMENYGDRERKYSLERSRRRRQVLDLVKTTAGCADCGYNENPVAMQFDHVNGSKVAAVGKMVTYSWSRIWEEIMKCDVVCSNCHDIRTDQRQKERWGIHQEGI